MILNKKIDRSNLINAGGKVTERETKVQIIESSRHHSDKKKM